MRSGWRGSFGLMVMSASTAVALARLISQGLRIGVILPMALAIIVADRGAAFAMRFRVHMVPAIAFGSLLAVLALLVGFDPALCDPTSAHFASAHLLSGQFHAARDALAYDGTPLPRLAGVVVALGALGGLAAAGSRGIWENQLQRDGGGARHIGALTGCVAPSFGVFTYTVLVSAERGRVAAAVAYFTGALVFVALADRAPVPAGPPRWRPRLRPHIGTIVGCALALGAVLGTGAGLSGLRLSVFHVTPPADRPPASAGVAGGAGGVPAQLLTGTALVDDLRTIELEKSDAIIFTARSPLPTYWQVATLATFDGTEWLPTSGVDAALAGVPATTATSLGPAALPTPAGGQQFSASVDVTAFASRLLPAPPHTVAVHGLHGAVVAADEGVLAASPSRTGTRYRVTARLNPTGSTSPTQLDRHDPRLAPYLALPRQPAVVDFLAHAVVGRDTTPGAEVQDLVNWFRSGRFRYTLDPPSTGGSDPLVQFLTVTRAGYCQQFAGAFGVMARTLGIPTRLVVGFSTGQPGPGDSYTVTGADAHVWPQVYLGPGTGWVSVEPTPAAAGTGSGAAGVIGPAASQPATPTTVAPATVTPATGSTRPTRATSPPVRGRGGSLTTGPVLLVVALALAVAAAGGAILYRRRGADRAGLPADQRIVGAWEGAHRVLRRHGLGRQPAETPAEYASRLRAWERQSARPVGADALGRLAALVELACYTPGPCTSGQADAALGCAAAVAAVHRRGPTVGPRRRHRRHGRSGSSGELPA